MLCALGMVNFQALLQDTPLPDKRLRTRATLLFQLQSLLQGQTANSLGMLSPADRTQESFTRGAYRFFDHEDATLPALHSPDRSPHLSDDTKELPTPGMLREELREAKQKWNGALGRPVHQGLEVEQALTK